MPVLLHRQLSFLVFLWVFFGGGVIVTKEISKNLLSQAIPRPPSKALKSLRMSDLIKSLLLQSEMISSLLV